MLSLKQFSRFVTCHFRFFSEGGIPRKVTKWLEDCAVLMEPKEVYTCVGTLDEREQLLEEMICQGTIVPLQFFQNCFLVRTDPRDTGTNESKIYSASYSYCEDPCLKARRGKYTNLFNVIEMMQAEKLLQERFYKIMKGKKMYIVPFTLGPPGCSMQILGIQITDSPLTALLLNITCRTGHQSLAAINCEHVQFIKAVHSTGIETPQPMPSWPCDPERFLLVHMPEKEEVWSYGSGFPDNAVLTLRSVALTLAASRGKNEGWLAEQMSVLGIHKCGEAPESKKYIGIMGPTGCGKSCMVSTLSRKMPEYKVTIISDNISWLKPNKNTGFIHAVNPEQGVVSFIAGMNWARTPVPMTASASNTIYFNIASTAEGSPWWEGLDESGDTQIIDWKGKLWQQKGGAHSTHPNAKFVTKLCQFSNSDPLWSSPEGVPLHAILVGCRRCLGVPLIYETYDWNHGVLSMAMLKSETFPTTEMQFNRLMPEPFGTRSFLGHKLGKYIDQWLYLGDEPGLFHPKIFFFNLFLKDSMGSVSWPGYLENIKILDWVLSRLKCSDANMTPIGLMPNEKDFKFDDPCAVDFEKIVFYDDNFWKAEMEDTTEMFSPELPYEVSDRLREEFCKLKTKIDEYIPGEEVDTKVKCQYKFFTCQREGKAK